jgi:hypothetical protein
MPSRKQRPQRTKSHRRNGKLLIALGELNRALDAAERSLPARRPAHPIVVVVGVPRSGTTLLTQWIAQSGHFCYPTNFLSRFYQAPTIGSMIQRLLFDQEMQFKDEFADIINARNTNFRSELGKTQGALSPHEFWFFWRRFFRFPDVPTSEQLFSKSARFGEFTKACGKIQHIFRKPFLLKGLIMFPYLEIFSKKCPQVKIVYIYRAAESNIASLLKARRTYFGSQSTWYSFKPREFARLKNLNATRQVTGQYRFINESIREALTRIPADRQLTVEYEDFCRNPAKIYRKLAHLCGIPRHYTGPLSFSPSTAAKLTVRQKSEIEHDLRSHQH